MTRRRPCAAACFRANANPDSVFPPPVGTVPVQFADHPERVAVLDDLVRERPVRPAVVLLGVLPERHQHLVHRQDRGPNVGASMDGGGDRRGRQLGDDACVLGQRLGAVVRAQVDDSPTPVPGGDADVGLTGGGVERVRGDGLPGTRHETTQCFGVGLRHNPVSSAAPRNALG